jgi:hypothetical protein
MHEASRNNRDAVPVGGTYRFENRFPVRSKNRNGGETNELGGVG